MSKLSGTYFVKFKKDGSLNIPKNLRFAIENGFSMECADSCEGFPYLRIYPADNGNELKNGHIMIPEYMRNYAMLNDKTMVIGAQDRIEIWNPTALKIEFVLYKQREMEKKAKKIF